MEKEGKKFKLMKMGRKKNNNGSENGEIKEKTGIQQGTGMWLWRNGEERKWGRKANKKRLNKSQKTNKSKENEGV